MAGPAAKAVEDKPLFGIALMLLAYACFANIDTSVKWLAVFGLPALQLAFMRYAGHFFISLGLLLKNGATRDSFNSDRLGLTIIRGCLIMVSTVLNFVALKYLPLTLTSTILFSAPMIICALAWPLLGERVGIYRTGAILLGFVGIVIAIRPFDETFHWAAIFSLSAAFCFALYTLLTRKLAGIVSTNTMQFYSGAVGFFALLPFAVWQWQNPQTLWQWLLLITLGFWGWAGHQLLTNAHRLAAASVLSPYSYSFIVYLTIYSYFLFDHLPDRWTLTGGAIIIAAGLIIWLRERHKQRLALEAQSVVVTR
ncbi:MAG: DMT family transporter [Pseudomonadota bacterium]